MILRVLGISSGLGVSLHPFLPNVIGNVEGRAVFHTAGNEQWKANFGKVPLDKTLFRDFGKVHVIVSSPDCGSGSVLRYSRAKKLGNHKENASLALFFEGIEKYRPSFFLFENLNGLFKSFPQDEFQQMVSKYHLVLHDAPVSAWGNSQVHRKRLVIVGIRKSLVKEYPDLPKFFKLPKKPGKPSVCQELYGDLGREENFESGHVRLELDSVISIYGGCRISLREIRKRWKDNPTAKRWVVTDRKYENAPGVYRNLNNHYPSTATKGNRQFDQLGLTLSPRQLARVQGIPDKFKIVVKEARKGYWINKARAVIAKTPPYEISVWFNESLDKAITGLGL